MQLRQMAYPGLDWVLWCLLVDCLEELMANAAAGVLALSLIVAGLSILGEVLGYWKLPSDIWGAVILLLGTAGRWASTRIPGRSGSRELGATNGDKSQQKPEEETPW